MINKIVVSDLDKARSQNFLKKNEINYVVSFLDPDLLDRFYELYLYNFKIPWTYYLFYDIEFEETDQEKPERQDIEKFIELCNKLINSSKEYNILLHCTAGICRSTAGAFILLYMLYKNLDVAKAELLSIRSIAWPNRLMLFLYDEINNYETDLMGYWDIYREENKNKLISEYKKQFEK